MAEIDLYNTERNFQRVVERIKISKLPERNKALLLEFKDDCLSGWGDRKLSKCRVLKLLSHLSIIAGIVDKDFDCITERDVKGILQKIDGDENKGEWARRDYRIALRKFVKWLREEHGYPEDYPNREKYSNVLLFSKYPAEVTKIKVSTPDSKVSREDIPTQNEMGYLRESAINSRDKAYFAGSEELGPRIGGWGTRKIKHVEFDEMGAKVTMSDKTMNNETVRLVWSASYLRDWLESHPFKNNPEAPLWIDLTAEEPKPLTYSAFRKIINSAIKRHNKKADASGGKVPRMTRKMRTHLFRYFAQTRDELEGVPRSVQIKQRGWSPASKQPEKYAKIVSKDVDEYYRKKFGLNGSNDNGNNKPITCSRCKDVNFPNTLYCKRCGLPLHEKARKYDAVIDDLIEKIILDPELSQRLREKLLEIKTGGENEV